MKFGVLWSVKGIRPEARETAKEAARRSGLALGDWLNTVILQQAAQAGVSGTQPPAQAPYDEKSYRQEIASVHQRLDELTRRIEYFTRTGSAAYAPRRENNESQTAALIGRLDQRLEQMVAQPQPPAQPMVPPLAPAIPGQRAQVPMPPTLDRALAEIAARQRLLNGEPVRQRVQLRPAFAEPQPAAVPTQDISGLEQQLRKITDQIETLRKPGLLEAVNALRDELGEIARSLNEAMPKQAIDTIERQIAGLDQRIAEGRQAGIDASALAGIERGLTEVRDALQGLTPAEQLIGFNEAVTGLAQKIDLIVAQRDPATLRQLQSALTTLRSMASNVASNEAVSRLAAEVQILADKVDHIGRAPIGDLLNNLEHRIDALGEALAERAEAGNKVPPRLEALVQSLSDKIEQLQQSRDDNVAVSHLEDRIVRLMERLDASDSRLGHLEAIERGLADLLVHIEEMRTARQEPQSAESPPALDPSKFDALKEDIARSQDALKLDMVRGQDALKQDMARSQDTLTAVHGTLSLVVDRLATIEKDIRSERPAAPPSAPAPEPAAESEPLELIQPVGKLAVRLVSDSSEPAPSIPLPASEELAAPAQPLTSTPAGSALEQVLAAAQRPRPAQAYVSAAPVVQAKPVTQIAPEFPLQAKPQAQTVQEIPPPAKLPPQTTPELSPPRALAAAQRPINPDLPPDQPLEPGSGPPQFRAHPAARIAASEAALGGAAPAPQDGNSPSNFIAAARRAAQAAMQEQAADKPDANAADKDEPGTLSVRAKMMKRVKSLLVAASIVALVVGSVQIVRHRLFSRGNGSKVAQRIDTNATPMAPKIAIAPTAPDPLTAPKTITVPSHNRQSMTARSANELLNAPLLYSPDITGSIPDSGKTGNSSPPPHTAVPSPHAEQLPSAIGGHRLRKAALAGNPGAAYEVAMRFAEGRGVPANPQQAAQWYKRAADEGLAVAQFRYASMLEKGVGVKKDLNRARQLYLAAAEQGNAKAMHNLAVLYAEGIDGKPDYATAVKWFRKAAHHGIDDSQYNLGILYARGIGVAKNLVESYKWFALAAAHGDKESARKRDQVASQLDARELAEARRAVKDFKVEHQPEKATAVPSPSDGWEKAKAAPPKSQPAISQPITSRS